MIHLNELLFCLSFNVRNPRSISDNMGKKFLDEIQQKCCRPLAGFVITAMILTNVLRGADNNEPMAIWTLDSQQIKVTTHARINRCRQSLFICDLFLILNHTSYLPFVKFVGFGFEFREINFVKILLLLQFSHDYLYKFRNFKQYFHILCSRLILLSFFWDNLNLLVNFCKLTLNHVLIEFE